MSSLDRNKPYGVISGHTYARYQQDGLLYGGNGELLGTPKTVAASVEKEGKIQTDQLVSAKAFLLNILNKQALAKAKVYTEAENNNQSWDAVKTAAADMGIIKFTYQKSETWRLPEEV